MYDVEGFDIVLGKRCMHDIIRQYPIDHERNEMWIADNLWEEREDGRVHYLPGLSPLDNDEGIVEQAIFMGIHIIRKAELKNLSTHLMKQALLIQVHHRGDGDTLPTEPPAKFQDMLTEFQVLFGKPTDANSQKGRQVDFETKTDPNVKIPFPSPYRISPCEEAELQRQIDNAIRRSWIQHNWSYSSSPVLFVPKPDGTLHMWIDYRAVNAITVKDRYPLPLIEYLHNAMPVFCWFTQLDLAAGYHQIRIATADRHKMAFTTEFCLYEWRVVLFGLANAPSQFMCMMNAIL